VAENPTGDTKTELSSKLNLAVAELRRTRQERYRIQRRHDSVVRSLKDRLAELEARKSALTARAAAVDTEVAEAVKEVEGLKAESESIRSRLERAGSALSEWTKRLREVIESSIPFRLEPRLEALDTVHGKADEEALRDRLRNFVSVLDYEIALGSTSEAYRSRIIIDEDRMPRARCIRLGMVTLAFVTEDGRTTGILVATDGGGYRWKTDLAFWERWGVKRAMEILEKRRPPLFIRYPMDLGRIGPGPGSTASDSGEMEGKR
jgi:hypothetical protein